MSIFDKTYELTVTKDYVSHWGAVQAVREFIQNALDSKSPFVYEWYENSNSVAKWTLKLNSEHDELHPRTLLLGATSKKDSTDSIGSFGEGYKIALLVLTRLGYRVEIWNGEVRWSPRFRYNKLYGEETLVIDETSLPFRSNVGVTVVIADLTPEDKEAITASCLKMQDEIGEIKSTSYGDVLLDRPSKLYVGSLYICETELKYGYNIKPAYIRLERDRQTVSSWDLKDITLKMWLEVGDYELMAKQLRDNVPDVSYAEWGMPDIVKEECYKLFRKDYPHHVVAKNQEELQRLVKRGLEKTVVVTGGYYSGITGSNSYRSERAAPPPPTPEQYCRLWLTTNRHDMGEKAIKAFDDLVTSAKGWIHK